MAIDTEERKTSSSSKNSGVNANNKKAIKIVLIVVGVLIVLGILGSMASVFIFKKGAEGFLSSITGGKVKVDSDKNGGSYTFKDDSGNELKSSAGDNVSLPEGFPSEIPIYKNSKLKFTQDLSVDEIKNYTVTFATDDSVADVVNFYKSTMKSPEWKLVSSSNSNEMSMLQYQNGAKKMYFGLTVNPDDESKTAGMLSVRIGGNE